MKKIAKKSNKNNKFKTLEEKVDFIVHFLQTQVVTKDYLCEFTADFARKSDIVKVKNQIDSLAKQIKDYHQEMIALVHRVERMEMWIKKASVKLGIPYSL